MSFWGTEVCDRKLMKEICRGIRWLPDDKEKATINKKMQARWRRDGAG
jgi:hypothetical protein